MKLKVIKITYNYMNKKSKVDWTLYCLFGLQL